MTAVAAGARAIVAPAVLALVGALTAGAAWLGVAEAPSESGTGARWQNLLADTMAPGSLSFVSVTRTTGAVASVATSEGWIDFSTHDAHRVSVVRSPNFPAQWSEDVVVGGRGYEHLGADAPKRRPLAGAWTPLDAFAVAPLPALAGEPAPEIGDEWPVLRRVGTVRLSGIITTEYELSAVSVTCVGAAGQRSSETTHSSAWVDGDGRIRQFENTTDVALGGFESAVVTVTVFGHFGAPASINTPARVAGRAGSSNTPSRGPSPLAGCLVTPS